MKKVISLILGAVIAASVLSGCSNSSNTNAVGNAETKSNRKKIRVLMEASESNPTYKMWSELFDGYLAEKKLDTPVEYELLPNDSDYANKLQLYIAGNDLPDFYGCANGTFSKAAKEIGSIVNIGQELKKLNKYEDMNKAVINFLTDADDGEMYLFPNALYSEFFWYRKDKFEQYGLQVPKTWDDFVNVSKVLKSKNEIPVVIGGKDQWQIMRYLSFMPWRTTHDGFIKGYINQTDSFAKNDSAQKAVNLVATMGKEGYFQPGFADSSYDDATNMFFGGQGAIFYGGSGQIDKASEMYKNGQLGMFPVPDVSGAQNISTNVPIHAGFANAFNAKTYDDVMQGFLAYVTEHYNEVTYKNGLFSPFNYEMPKGLNQLFYDIQPMFKDAKESWVSWDDKLDPATVVSMEDAQKELALGMITPQQFIEEMDKVVKENSSNKK